jgi:hypothetical protein
LGPPDVFGIPSIATSCFRKKFFGEDRADFLSHMPLLNEFFETLPVRPKENPKGIGALDPTVYRETMGCFFEQVARGNEEGPSWVDSGDIDELAALSHYLETLFNRFDVDQNGLIDFDEGMRVFPLINPLLAKAQASAQAAYEQNSKNDNPLRSLTSDYRRLAALAYMLKYGDAPGTTDFIEWLAKDYAALGGSVEGSHPAWQYQADRARVLQIMGVISSVENSSGSGTIDTQKCFRW